MERAMSVEDKIRKAEEIYYKRREKEVPRNEDIKIRKRQKNDFKLFKKMIKQIIVCLAIYTVFYLVVNNNYVFSEDFTNKAKEILSKDINFSEMYIFICDKYSEFTQNINNTENKNEEIQENPQTKLEDIQNNDENIGGAEEVLTQPEQNVENNIQPQEQQQEEIQPLSQMEQDANYIKSSISFIKPVNGVITSRYGERNPTTPTVPKNHTGTDIAAVIGTKIVSATDGKVILSSSQGDYGNHLKIQIDDVIIVYAHCKTLYVREGDSIVQGQEIAEVGATGNVTGPHLHFEVRYKNRYVDPQMILEL